MARNSLFWGGILLIGGVLLLLSNLGLLAINVWGLIWPLFLVALGLSILWGIVAGPGSIKAEEAAVSLEGASRARVRVRHGAGRLYAMAGTDAEDLASGTFGGGLDYRARRDGDVLDVEMKPTSRGFPFSMVPWNWGGGGLFDWSFDLNSEIPLSLDFETGASDTKLDLTDLKVTDLRLQTGASATDLTLPANAGQTRAVIRAGAASVIIRVPSAVAARIRAEGGLAAIKVDRNRFPRAGNVYQSPDYDTAINKVDVDIETGMGSIEIS